MMIARINELAEEKLAIYRSGLAHTAENRARLKKIEREISRLYAERKRERAKAKARAEKRELLSKLRGF